MRIVAASTAHAVRRSGPGACPMRSRGPEADPATIRGDGLGRCCEPVLLAAMGRSRLPHGEHPGALVAAKEVLAVMDGRRLTACAPAAPIALARVPIATRAPRRLASGSRPS